MKQRQRFYPVRQLTFRILQVRHPVLVLGLLALVRLATATWLSLELELVGDLSVRIAGPRRSGRIWIFVAFIGRKSCVDH